ncbi:UDP-N-acetylglucosamine 1-carboxyvinyltransferase [Helicobacter cetorum]|uniref:UDP-N-acetylglucosamine 1-carboxyvinyltransferase n=1 Tax=Helicobacter cetorum (strain ATCC BAA-540 / CCUG 52418 / MIT 99-5656) TaxID=1163745 RepID=I0ETT1_HELCM|nr:UDP-N-acetylglucosamine 1-carboxyvinyltransferase [Helicobacter cetorum]AFI06350.1 UDP-N-acetylglucosamine 1-carboxyvinyltransferase [Helicobacter cetorum MIT 99-5656]
MDFLEIVGQSPLKGTINISGAKNAALPILAATLLSQQEVKIRALPIVADIKAMALLLQNLGVELEWLDTHTLKACTKNLHHTEATYDLVRKMRASILVLGPLLARFKECLVSLPGGCAIGTRPVDLHLKAMQQLGAEIKIEQGYIHAKAPKGLKGNDILFDKITVTGTENALMAASLAKGTTRIINAAKEPEITQLCEFLQSGGVEIEGIGTSELKIRGTENEALRLKDIQIIPDRIEAGTYLCVGAISNCQLKIENVMPNHLQAISDKLIEIGFKLDIQKNSIEIYPTNKRHAFEITTQEYPGFPTDMQAQFMALATQCLGTSIIQETLFENRFMHASELQRLGANISLKTNIATISGSTELTGSDVMATDLRASSALILAALVAQGVSRVHRIYHLDRGYESLENKMSALGVKIKRLKEK